MTGLYRRMFSHCDPVIALRFIPGCCFRSRSFFGEF